MLFYYRMIHKDSLVEIEQFDGLLEMSETSKLHGQKIEP